MYLHYYAIIIILVEKWSQNNNIIVYRNHFWDNLSSRKMCYHVRHRIQYCWSTVAYLSTMTHHSLTSLRCLCLLHTVDMLYWLLIRAPPVKEVNRSLRSSALVSRLNGNFTFSAHDCTLKCSEARWTVRLKRGDEAPAHKWHHVLISCHYCVNFQKGALHNITWIK